MGEAPTGPGAAPRWGAGRSPAKKILTIFGRFQANLTNGLTFVYLSYSRPQVIFSTLTLCVQSSSSGVGGAAKDGHGPPFGAEKVVPVCRARNPENHEENAFRADSTKICNFFRPGRQAARSAHSRAQRGLR